MAAVLPIAPAVSQEGFQWDLESSMNYMHVEGSNGCQMPGVLLSF